MNHVVNNADWLKRWSENRIGFHIAGVNPLLERFLPRVTTTPGRTLVPLCGKSADLAWLAAQGHIVVGVDLSEIAARAFASEQGMAVTIASEPPFTVFRGERLTYYVGDFFNIHADRIGRFDLIYDRAALIALPPGVRAGYVEQLKSLLVPGGRILLISLDYDPSQMQGPPFCVPEAEVRTLFADFTVTKLYEYDCLDDEPHFKDRGLTWMKEAVWAIGRKTGTDYSFPNFQSRKLGNE